MLISPPIGFQSEPLTPPTPQGNWRLGPQSTPTLLLGGAVRPRSVLDSLIDTQAKREDGKPKPRPKWKRKVPVADTVLSGGVGGGGGEDATGGSRAGDSALVAVRVLLAAAAPADITVKKKGQPRAKKTVKITEIKSEYPSLEGSNSTDKENVSTAAGTNSNSNSTSNTVQENENEDDSALHHPAKAVSLRTAILDSGNGFYATKSRLHAPGTTHSAALLGPTHIRGVPPVLGPRTRPVPSVPSHEPACAMDVADGSSSSRCEIALEGGGSGASGVHEGVFRTTTMTGCGDGDEERSGYLEPPLTALMNPMVIDPIDMDSKVENKVENKVESEEELALRLRVVMSPAIASVQAAIAAAKEAYESERVAEAALARAQAVEESRAREVSVIADQTRPLVGIVSSDTNISSNSSSSSSSSSSSNSRSMQYGTATVNQTDFESGLHTDTEVKSVHMADFVHEVHVQHNMHDMDACRPVSESLCENLPAPALPLYEGGAGDTRGDVRVVSLSSSSSGGSSGGSSSSSGSSSGSGSGSGSAGYTDISRVISSVSGGDGSEDTVLLVVQELVDSIVGAADHSHMAVQDENVIVNINSIISRDSMDIDHSDSITNTNMISSGPCTADAAVTLTACEKGGNSLVSAVQDAALHYSVQSAVALTADILCPLSGVPAAIPAPLPSTVPLPSSTSLPTSLPLPTTAPLPPSLPLPSSTPASEFSLGPLSMPDTLPSAPTDSSERIVNIEMIEIAEKAEVEVEVEVEVDAEVEIKMEVEVEVEDEDESMCKPCLAVDTVKRIRRPRAPSLPPIAASGVPLLAGWKATDARTLDHTFQSRPQSPVKAPKGLFHSNITASKLGARNLDPGSASSAWLDFRSCCLCSSANSEEESREKEDKEDREEEEAMRKKCQSPLSIKIEKTNRIKAEKEVEKEVSPIAQDDPVCGRLLPFSDGSHVHANCLRWSTDVIERGGRLLNASQAKTR
jgi:hypothetical protein